MDKKLSHEITTKNIQLKSAVNSMKSYFQNIKDIVSQRRASKLSLPPSRNVRTVYQFVEERRKSKQKSRNWKKS